MQESFDTNLVKIHSAGIEKLPISCFVLFLVTADDGHLELAKLQNNRNGFMEKSL